jgi:REP element-mobilizing transposase RayT
MPNHVHGILWLSGAERAGLKPAPTGNDRTRHGLSESVRALKTFSARRINELRGTPGIPVWQRNYYERVVRNERELNAIRDYIQTNPLRWHLDKENPLRAT